MTAPKCCGAAPMDRPRILRLLRIAFSAVCAICCGLIILLWISSYYVPFRIGFPPLRLQSWKGVLEFNSTFVRTASGRMQFVELYHLPHWLPALFFGGLAALPWVQWYRRFSLRLFNSLDDGCRHTGAGCGVSVIGRTVPLPSCGTFAIQL